MNVAVLVGIALVVFGAVVLAYDGIPYTEEDTVIDIGEFEMRTTQEKRIPGSPLIGGLAIAGGVLLMLVSRGRRR